MKLFSQRKGLKPVRQALQSDSMDEALRKHFSRCPWFEVYDLMEFILGTSPLSEASADLMRQCNRIFEEELSACRFVGGKITQITRADEIAAVEGALVRYGRLDPVASHLNRAPGLLADNKQPDFRNSIKESISALEALCKVIAGEPRATLGGALKRLEGRVVLRPAVKAAFGRLYGYTSDAERIGHAMLEEPSVCFHDAKFMLVCCSAFVNFLVAKASAAGINL